MATQFETLTSAGARVRRDRRGYRAAGGGAIGGGEAGNSLRLRRLCAVGAAVAASCATAPAALAGAGSARDKRQP